MKKLKTFGAGLFFGYFIVIVMSMLIYSCIFGILLLFTWNLQHSTIISWNNIWLTLDAVRIANGIGVIVGIIIGICFLADDDKKPVKTLY